MKVTMEEGSDEGWQERAGWTVVVVSAAGEKVKRAELSAKRAVVGAGARMLFYPTLLYNVVRNKLESEFRWWDEIDEYVLLGAVPFPGDVVRLKDVGVHAVVTMNEAYETLVPTSMYEAHGIDHMVIPTRDYMFAPSFGDIRRGVEFINDHVQRKQRTYVHCKAGRGRSTTVVLCYLVQYKGMTPMEAFQYVRGKRPRVLLASAQWRAVGEYSRRIRGLAVSGCVAVAKVRAAGGTWSGAECGAGRAEEAEGSRIDEPPVVVSRSDLVGYGGMEDCGVVGNEIWKEVGMVYRVRLIAAARASAAWGRVSCVWLGWQGGGGVVAGGMGVERVSAGDVVSCGGGGVGSTWPGAVGFSGMRVRICEAGMVSG
ncbi:phosphatidylglycerophosphate phosphatase PTPMT1-like [Physcomitrium patens]|uniref:phosphatidylglycerophosphate phosphatase PTPMT1-like n=1 Tax=Physcomitrium patens TaxID=3218 RepID=UPI003CCDFEAE